MAESTRHGGKAKGVSGQEPQLTEVSQVHEIGIVEDGGQGFAGVIQVFSLNHTGDPKQGSGLNRVKSVLNHVTAHSLAKSLPRNGFRQLVIGQGDAQSAGADFFGGHFGQSGHLDGGYGEVELADTGIGVEV
jgi:hypothetical protein